VIANPPVTIDRVLDELRARVPDVRIERLKVKWPADDDNLWFIGSGPFPDVQIGSHPDGLPPFLIEGKGTGERRETSDVADAVDVIVRWLNRP
jgi:hypothetical protein